jgi:hypothetical protein
MAFLLLNDFYREERKVKGEERDEKERERDTERERMRENENMRISLESSLKDGSLLT